MIRGGQISVKKQFAETFAEVRHHVFVDGRIHAIVCRAKNGSITAIIHFHVDPSWTQTHKNKWFDIVR